MAESTPTHDEDYGFVVRFKEGNTPIANTQKSFTNPFQNLEIPELPQSAKVDMSAMEQWIEENDKYRLQKERQENDRFWINFWLSVGTFIVALSSLILSLRK